MSNKPLKICAYCASSAQIDQAFFDAAETLALSFLSDKVHLVYGAGSIGLMGKLADVYLANDGKITGVIPQFMREVEWDHKGLTDLIVTETMGERKELLFEGVDAIIALPGGTGTLEELFEVITLKRLGKFLKPIVLLNTMNYYDPLIEMFNKMIDHKFLNESHREVIKVTDDPNQVLSIIRETEDWDPDAIHYAVNK